MAVGPTLFDILLIDDEAEELEIIRRIVGALTEAPVQVDHVSKASEAVARLNARSYDLVLLDNRLSGTISAEFSAPFIRSAYGVARVAVISSNIDEPYLHDPTTLGVDHVVDKADMIAFLRDQIDRHIEVFPAAEPPYRRRVPPAA
jgi:CheY-like chemotaxis protein